MIKYYPITTILFIFFVVFFPLIIIHILGAGTVRKRCLRKVLSTIRCNSSVSSYISVYKCLSKSGQTVAVKISDLSPEAGKEFKAFLAFIKFVAIYLDIVLHNLCPLLEDKYFLHTL